MCQIQQQQRQTLSYCISEIETADILIKGKKIPRALLADLLALLSTVKPVNLCHIHEHLIVMLVNAKTENRKKRQACDNNQA